MVIICLVFNHVADSLKTWSLAFVTVLQDMRHLIIIILIAILFWNEDSESQPVKKCA